MILRLLIIVATTAIFVGYVAKVIDIQNTKKEARGTSQYMELFLANLVSEEWLRFFLVI
jgi:hypothetical protein